MLAQKNNICFVYYSQGRDRWFGQVNPAPAADDWIDRFSFDILPMTDNTKLTASVVLLFLPLVLFPGFRVELFLLPLKFPFLFPPLLLRGLYSGASPNSSGTGIL